MKLSLKVGWLALPQRADRNHLLARSPNAAAALLYIHAHGDTYIYKTPNLELMMPGMKQFVTCAFMITAAKGKKMSFQISIERGEKRKGVFKGALFS